MVTDYLLHIDIFGSKEFCLNLMRTGQMAQVVRQIPSRSNLPHVANDSPPWLQPWSVGSGAMPRRWTPLTESPERVL